MLIAIEDSGMADRVQLMLCGYRLAEICHRDFGFVWEPSSWCGAHFSDLFQTKKYFLILDHDGWPNEDAIDFRATYWPKVAQTISSLLSCYQNATIKFHCYPQFHNVQDFGENGVIDFAETIKLRALPIAKRLKDAIGVHVRGTDYAQSMPPLDDYFRAIGNFSAGRPVFLATDDLAIRRAFSAHFQSRFEFYPTLEFARHSGEATIDAATELYLLRCCRSLVYSAYSGFSRLAIRTGMVPMLRPPSMGANPHSGIGVIEENNP